MKNSLVTLLLAVAMTAASYAATPQPAAPVAAAAFPAPIDICEGLSDGLSNEVDAETFDVTSLDDSVKVYNQQLSFFKKDCKNSPTRFFFGTMLETWQAWIAHKKGDLWQDSLNKAIQNLEQCITHYYGQPKGAACQTIQDKAIKWKTDWEAAGP
jgi:hypothetical protein